VYVGSSIPGGSLISRYNLTGNLTQTFSIAFRAATPLALALAPDECTMYSGAGGLRPARKHKLRALPTQWAAGRSWPSSPLSAYGS
jgi:hypothetical protein